MIKSELVNRIAAQNPHLFHRDVEKIVNVIFDEIISALSVGKRVELRGFGAFTVKHRKPRKGRNPKTGEAVHVSEKYVPFFKTGKELRERLNPKDPNDQSSEGASQEPSVSKDERPMGGAAASPF